MPKLLESYATTVSRLASTTSLQISHRNERHQFVIGVEYYHTGPLPGQIDQSYRESGATEYLHRLDDLLGGLCRSGLVIEDLREPVRADYEAAVTHYGYRGRYIPPYIRIKARRRPRSGDEPKSATIWTP